MPDRIPANSAVEADDLDVLDEQDVGLDLRHLAAGEADQQDTSFRCTAEAPASPTSSGIATPSQPAALIAA
jgi:hypothetical protein